MLAAQVGRFHAGLMLPQHTDDLILDKSASPHRSSPTNELIYQWHNFCGADECITGRRLMNDAFAFRGPGMGLQSWLDAAGDLD